MANPTNGIADQNRSDDTERHKNELWPLRVEILEI